MNDIASAQTTESTDGGEGTTGGSEGSTGGDWRSVISDQALRESPQIRDYKSIDDLIKGHNNHQSMVGQSVRMPGELATQEDWDNFYKKIGRPEKASEYQFKDPENIPDGLSINQNTKAAWADIAFKAGLRPEQANAIYDWYVNQQVSLKGRQTDAVTQAKEATQQALRAEWGDRFSAMAKNVNAAINKFFPEALRDGVMAMATQNADFAKAMADIGGSTGEDSSAGATSGNTSGGTGRSQNDIWRDIKNAQSDPGGAYRNRMHPEHAAEVQRVNSLFKELNNET